MIENKKKRRRHGPQPRPAEELRSIKVSVFLTVKEATEIRQKAFSSAITPAAYLRAAGLTRLPKRIPSINREAWTSLARVAGNLNQYQTAINEGHASGYPPEVIAKLRDQVQALRRDLLGVAEMPEEEEEANEGDE